MITSLTLKYILLAIAGVAEFAVLYMFFQTVIVLGYSLISMTVPADCDFDYIIVHGCGPIRGDKISKTLKSRLDKAIKVYHKGGDRAYLVLSGGREAEGRVSEAEAMRRYLVKREIPEEKMILEDQSRNTRQNLRFSKKLIDERPGSKKLALISSNYHIFRCMGIAKTLGIKCRGIGAKVRKRRWLSATLGEFRTEFRRKNKRLTMVRTFVLYAMVPTIVVFSILIILESDAIAGL